LFRATRYIYDNLRRYKDIILMTKYIIFRHGQTDWNKNDLILGHTDIPLNDAGKLQAMRIREKLSDKKAPDVIFSSDLQRCVQTAEIVYPNRKIIKTKLLREMNFGIYEGKNRWEVRKTNRRLFDEILDNPHHPLHLFTPLPEGESFAEAFQRLLKFLLQADKKYHGKQIALFTHGDITKSIFKINQMPVPEIRHGSFFCFDFDAETMSFADFEF